MGVCKSKTSIEQPEIIIKTTTWQRDSHGLFDYEGKEIDKKQYKGIGTFSIMRQDMHLELKYDNDSEKLEESKEEETPLNQIAKILEKNGGYWIYHNPTVEELEEDVEKNPEAKLWRVVKFCKSRRHNINGYKILPDDLIKLGRVRFKVRELCSAGYKKLQLRQQNKYKKYLTTQTRNSVIRSTRRKNSNDITDTDQNQVEHQNQESANIIPFPFSQPETPHMVIIPEQFKETENATPLIIREPSFGTSSGTPLCRICLSEDNDAKNPLFSPCKCCGTMKFVHLMCLQEWLNSKKVTKETPFTKTFYWKNLECELCKTAFPNIVKTGDNKNIFLRVIQYELPSYLPGEDPSYIVFESISSNTSKVIHVVNMLKGDDIKVGRGHDVDVRVTDISVSRVHAIIKKSQKGYFYIEDNHSKFGSLVLIRNPLMLKDGDPNIIQAGRTLMEVQIKRPIKIFNSCLCNQNEKNENTRSSAAAKVGLVSKNGFDFFPEEFLPVIGKIRKSGKILQSDSSRIRQGIHGPINTNVQSDINIEEAIVRDRQQLNSIPYNGVGEADDDQIDPQDNEVNISQSVQNRGNQMRSRSLIQMENNDGEEQKDATDINQPLQEQNDQQSKSRLKKAPNVPTNKRSSKFSKRKSSSKQQNVNSEEEKNDIELGSFRNTQQLNKSSHRLRKTIEHRNSNGNNRLFEGKEGDLRERNYYQSNDEIPIDTIQLQGSEYVTVAAQPNHNDNLDFEEQPDARVPSHQEYLKSADKNANQSRKTQEKQLREIEEEEKIKEDNIYSEVQKQLKDQEIYNKEPSSKCVTSIVIVKEQQIKNNKQMFQNQPFFDDEFLKDNIFSRDNVLPKANSNLPTERVRDTNDGNIQNRFKQSKGSQQSKNKQKKDQQTFFEDEMNSDFIQIPTIPDHQIISPDDPRNSERKLHTNFINNLVSSNEQLVQEQSDPRKQGLVQNLIHKQSENSNTVQFATFENNLVKKSQQTIEDDVIVQNLKGSFEEIKLQTPSKKRLINMNKSFENQKSQEIFTKNDQLKNYNQKSKDLQLGKQGNESANKKALDFYQSLSNFIPIEQDDDQQNSSQNL